MIDWPAVATRLGYASDTAMWQALYIERDLPMAEIAKRLGIGVSAVRDALIRCKVPLRPRGRPRRFTHAEILQIQKDGIQATADRLGLSYHAVYKRLRLSGAKGE